MRYEETGYDNRHASISPWRGGGDGEIYMRYEETGRYDNRHASISPWRGGGDGEIYMRYEGMTIDMLVSVPGEEGVMGRFT